MRVTGLFRAFPRLLLAVVFTACVPSVELADDVTARLSFDPAPHVGSVSCTVELVDAAGSPVAGADLEFEGNMNHAGMVPVFATPQEVEDGRYEAPLEFTMGGDWIVIVRGTLADGRALEQVLQVPGVPAISGEPVTGEPAACCRAETTSRE